VAVTSKTPETAFLTDHAVLKMNIVLHHHKDFELDIPPKNFLVGVTKTYFREKR
jgi:hypothetical protein